MRPNEKAINSACHQIFVEFILEFIYNQNIKEVLIMIIDTEKTVSMTEANQNFSKVARMAMEYGDVTILKNNKVFLTVHYACELPGKSTLKSF
jgi:hypothetical protein